MESVEREARLDEREDCPLLVADVLVEAPPESAQHLGMSRRLVEFLGASPDRHVLDPHPPYRWMGGKPVMGERGYEHLLLDLEVSALSSVPGREEGARDDIGIRTGRLP
jgi:hypothetical protein